MMTIDPAFLSPARFIQSDDPIITAYAREAANGGTDARDIAVRLYYAVRDQVIYYPYVRFNIPESYSAKDVLVKGSGFCIPKAALLTACARAMGLAARIGFADVPYERITATYGEISPRLMVDDPWGRGADFAAEAQPET